MEINQLLQNQIREALDPVNKWYCSQYYGFEVTDPNLLLAYYIKHGGAKHFRDCIAPQFTKSRTDAALAGKTNL